MPQDPPSHPPDRPALRPAQVLRNSPLAASVRMQNLHASRRPRPRLAWRRTLAIAGSVVVHILFLFAFVLGPAWEPPPGAETASQLKLRFIELPELAPPPPPKGTPSRKVGPTHQGRAIAARRTAATAPAATPPPAVVKAVPKPSAAPPQPELHAVPLSPQTPVVSLAKPALQPPKPPSFQPQPLRAPQLEGTQAMPPPPSPALPEVPALAAPSVSQPSVTLDKLVAGTPKPSLSPPVAVPPPAEPQLDAVPVSAPPAPSVQIQAQLQVTATPPSPPLAKPQAPAPVAEPEAPLAAIPLAPAAAPSVTPTAHAALQVPATTAKVELTPAALPAAAADVSSAPDASPQGRDDAQPGAPQGVAKAAETLRVHGAGPLSSQGLGKATQAQAQPGKGEQAVGTGEAGKASAAGAATKPATLPDYVQLKPSGNTEVMHHKVPGVDYKPTRFEPDWAPEGESSVDTALRRAVEKTTLKHTFRLPRGIRVKCVVMPLVPVSLLGCGNGDPPPEPVAAKVYDKLHQPLPQGGAVPAVAPSPAASAPAAAPVALDNSALCAAARVAGGPLPPGCPRDAPATRPALPAPSSSAWVPASDQFH